MRIRWRGLELPSRVVRDEQVSTDTYGKFTAEPFERGFGTTVGNSLRRILLSSLEGAAVTHIRLKGAEHEFSSLPGVMEDVNDIILNVKSLIVKLDADEPKEMKISVKKAGAITGGMIEADPAITIINTDLVLCTLTEDMPFEMALTVDKGRGYVTAADNISDSEEQEIGLIAVDSIYSPVTRVRYATEDARVGQKTDYDRLILEIWTNGTLSPEMALVEASKILRKHLNPFVQYFELGSDVASEDAVAALRDANKAIIDPELQQKLGMSIQ
jgi:DNA-directed RNA polymerase subunit alpha